MGERLYYGSIRVFCLPYFKCLTTGTPASFSIEVHSFGSQHLCPACFCFQYYQLKWHYTLLGPLKISSKVLLLF